MPGELEEDDNEGHERWVGGGVEREVVMWSSAIGHEVLPSRWVGGLCDEHVEEDDGREVGHGGGGGVEGVSEAEPTSGLEGERGLG